MRDNVIIDVIHKIRKAKNTQKYTEKGTNLVLKILKKCFVDYA